jgi:SPW repeat
MSKWTRWQSWVALAAGVYGFLSPIWTATTPRATGTLVVLGIVTALVALGSLAAPGAVALEWLIAVLGVLSFISPWVMGFASTTGMAWTAWVLGVIWLVAGLWSVPESNRVHRGQLSAQH